MSLRERRVQFSVLSARLLLWINEKEDWSYGKVECAFDEGPIHQQRHVKVGVSRTIAMDAVHIPTSRHYEGLAFDLLVYINGVYITSGDHPIWSDIDKQAQLLHPKLSLGKEFHDANHLSWAEGDQA